MSNLLSSLPMSHDDLCQLIPHAGSMCLLHEVLSVDDRAITCSARSHHAADNPLYKDNRLSSLHLVEYAAQAVAVHGGLLAQQNNLTIRAGYLAAIRDVTFTCDTLHALADELLISASQLMANAGNMMYEFKVQHADQALASGRLTIMTMPASAD